MFTFEIIMLLQKNDVKNVEELLRNVLPIANRIPYSLCTPVLVILSAINGKELDDGVLVFS